MMITSLKCLPKNLLLLTFTFALVISCGKNDETSSSDPALFDSQIIIGSVDWKEISDLSTTNSIRKASSPVADVTLPVMGSRCTGFLISEDVLMTNEHCIPSAAYAEGVTASFRHLKGVSESNWEEYDCSTFLMNNAEFDFALLKCSGSPGRKFGFVEIDSSHKSTGTSVYIVQQNCDYYSSRNCDWTKKYSKGSITEVADEYTHNADTLGGSSGSPMFDASSHKVVGLHHAGLGNNGMGRGYENYAVKMSEIVPVINARFPSLLGGGTPSSGDQTEDNNTLSKAFSLKGSSETLSGLSVESSDDLDYYSLKAARGAQVSVSVKFSHSKGDLDVYLVNSSGGVVKKVESSSDNEEFSYVSTGEKVYFVVFGYKGAVNTYKMHVTVSSQNVENDSFETAKALDTNHSEDYSLSKNENDFFSFEVSRTSSVSVKIEFTHSRGDLDMKIFDKNKKVVASSLSTKNVEEVTKSLAKGKYYVQVYGYKGAANDYSLTIRD
ncbi:hypothetical protein BIY24_02495 [Halobacteriovorax marinus]|uniref:Serine protease n=1 Tax=Halobacteriovorax marinus (strain ATCC BAA-682 / DSM 15412 / SJ) TaxID=862908 RepID=E1X4I3_HALMS|nr:serine protease [Halobacteriovorax marinus]ATH06846.1 hypothetical protein BIY24_02495 [Halobacteriovorax marinus]CBW25413.1 putative lipoprotein [Halobacteriovorax marinus SJ]